VLNRRHYGSFRKYSDAAVNDVSGSAYSKLLIFQQNSRFVRFGLEADDERSSDVSA
jgi:hypothetical protein